MFVWVCVSQHVCVFFNEMVSPWTIIPVTGLGRNTHVNTAKWDCTLLSIPTPTHLSLLLSMSLSPSVSLAPPRSAAAQQEMSGRGIALIASTYSKMI